MFFRVNYKHCDLQDPPTVFGADLYYHNINICINMSLAPRTWFQNCLPNSLSRVRLWQGWSKPEKNGKGYELSAIRNYLNSIDDHCNFRNRDVKIFLINQFGSEIDFTYPDSSCKSIMVFSVSNNAANRLAECMQWYEYTRSCTKLFRFFEQFQSWKLPKSS